MFKIDTAAFTSYVAAATVALFSTTMLFAVTAVPSVAALSGSVA
jgi:hypothetical protein